MWLEVGTINFECAQEPQHYVRCTFLLRPTLTNGLALSKEQSYKNGHTTHNLKIICTAIRICQLFGNEDNIGKGGIAKSA